MNATGSQGQRMQGHFNKTSLQRVEDNTAITLNLRIYKNASLFGQNNCYAEDVDMKPADIKSIKFRIVQLQNFVDKVQELRMLLIRMMQVHLQKLPNINLTKNVPTNLMRNVLQPSKQKYRIAFKQIMQTLEDERNRMYPTAQGGSASKKRRQKENRIK